MKSNIILKIRLNLEYFLVFIIYKIISILPIFFVSLVGGILFAIIGPYTKTQKIVKKNYLHIFPLATKKQISKETQLCWFNMGKTFFELLILPKIIFSKDKIQVEGLNNIHEVIKKNEQVIFVGIHQSNWEILLPTIDKLGINVGGIYRHINNPYINKLILKIRQKCIISNKSFYTPKGKQSAKEIIDGIKNGLSIVLLVDQKDSAGEIVPFFNKLSKTQVGFLKVARKHKMRIVPVQNIRKNNNNFKIQFYPPIDKFSKEISDIEAMKKIHIIIEKWIKDNPSSWFMQHNRFN
jgi:KDO2-lipid IV(A) lauroyltransferase